MKHSHNRIQDCEEQQDLGPLLFYLQGKLLEPAA
jgi:hypothetical protein